MSSDKKCLKKLKSLRNKVNWELAEDRHVFHTQLSLLIENWEGELPNLRDIFRPAEIDWLLVQDVFKKTDSHKFPIIDFVIRTDYKDEPELDKDGKPSSRRTTPLHITTRRSIFEVENAIPKLFEIYDWFDVNYIDEESGYTHFHIACEYYGCEDVVRKFLENGQDPNCLIPETGDSPLHLALAKYRIKVADLLLRNGANPNLANKDGLTPLHVMCKRSIDFDHEAVVEFFKICEKLNKPVQVNARDELGRTPIHLVISCGYVKLTYFLQIKGADLNLASKDGSTPLHVVCKIQDSKNMAEQLLKPPKGKNEKVKIDAVDKLGRTPLQWAVANLLSDVVDTLLNNGADLYCFVFPTEDYFAERYTLDCTLQMVVFPTMSIIKSLESKGYELDQRDALTIMKTFAKHGLIDDLVDIDECLRKDKEFMKIAKRSLVTSSLSLYEFLLIPPKEAEKVFTLEDYNEFTSEISHLCDESHRAYIRYLCETVTRGFLRQWALELFSKKSPWLFKNYCESIINPMKVKGLWDICMQAANENTQWLNFIRTDYVKKYYNRKLKLSYSFGASYY